MAIRLQFEDVRCFFTRQEAIIRSITLLVGENSSGKSTFLALCQIAASIVEGFDREILFNEPPFLLGAYDQIASYRGGRAGRARSFSVAVSANDDRARSGCVEATFVSERGQPMLRSWRLSAGPLMLEVKRSGTATVSVLGQSPRGEAKVRSLKDLWAAQLLRVSPGAFWKFYGERIGKLKPIFTDADWARLRRAWQLIYRGFGRSPYAFAPIRTSPQRTYDPVSAEPGPEGGHIPMLLADLSHSVSRAEWVMIESGLNEFGANSGLFEQIEVIRKGKKESDPFQIGVKSRGPTFNLVDVGYGVSQVLPIVIDTLQRSGKNTVFLMQQPEVHLHPKAQAELGSFFARLATQGPRFIVETHSDYLVDRVRMEVRRGERLKPEDVSVLYFERQKQGVMVHNVELDKQGSVTNPPPGYRKFFLDEERALLSV